MMSCSFRIINSNEKPFLLGRLDLFESKEFRCNSNKKVLTTESSRNIGSLRSSLRVVLFVRKPLVKMVAFFLTMSYVITSGYSYRIFQNIAFVGNKVEDHHVVPYFFENKNAIIILGMII
jgi:hypothetical protein